MGFYLGSAMLTKGTTGLGVIQKPLRDKYFAFRKSLDNKLGPEIGIRINPRGIILMFPGSHQGQANDEFYEMSSIHFIEAVQFVTSKHKDKKFYGAFVPIDESHSTSSQDKMFVHIEKKFNHLTKISHPPMLACVMRRPTGVKAVDCHMLVIPVVEDALRMADMVHRFQARPNNPEHYYGKPRDIPPESDVILRRMGASRELGPLNAAQRDSDDYAYLYKGRGFELKQEHFNRDNEEANMRREQSDRREIGEEQHRYQPPIRDRSEVRNSDRFMRDQNPRDFEGGPYSDMRPRDSDRHYRDPVDMHPREFAAASGRYVERDSFGSEHEFDNRVIHERQHSGGERDVDRHYEGRYTDEYPGKPNVSQRGAYNEPRTRGPDNYPGRFSDISPDKRRGPWQDRGSGDVSRGERPDSDEPPFARHIKGSQSRSPPQSPRIRSPPRSQSPHRVHSSPRTPDEDDVVYSVSNLESRIEDMIGGKPVAKVIPNRHAGIRVLPSLPIPGAQNMLKPVSPRTSDVPSKIEEKPPFYNFDTKSDSEEESPYDNAPDINLLRQNRTQSDGSPLIQRQAEHDPNTRVKSENKWHGYSNKLNPSVTNSTDDVLRYGDNTGYDSKQQHTQWSFDGEKEKFMKNRDADGFSSVNHSKSAHEGFSGGPAYRESLNDRGGRHMKDMEIEDMFSNLRTSRANRNDVDFESTLGYLP